MTNLSSVKKLLFDTIHCLESRKLEFIRNPNRDFSRNRKLSLIDTVNLILSMETGSLRNELHDYFSFSADTVTCSAFIQQRDKIKPALFQSLFYSFTDRLPDYNRHKYRYFAVDGSDILIPLARNEPQNKPYQYFGRDTQSPYYQMHLNAVYDLVNERYAAAHIEPRRGHNERNAIHGMLEEQSFPPNSVFIFDRGYEGYPLMAHITKKGQYYIIRAKDYSVGGIVKGLGIPKEGEFDVIYDKILTIRHDSEAVNDTEHYHRVHCSNSPYFLNKSIREYHLPFRIVRFCLSPGTYECLLTNLPNDEFDIQAIKKLYGMRWGIETSFRQLKYSVGLVGFHSKKIESIEQEIWARLILYNFSMSVKKGIEKRKTKSKFSCKINVTNAIQVCRRFLKLSPDETPPNMEWLISRELIPVRADRKAPRKTTYKYPRKFCYRI